MENEKKSENFLYIANPHNDGSNIHCKYIVYIVWHCFLFISGFSSVFILHISSQRFASIFEINKSKDLKSPKRLLSHEGKNNRDEKS